MSAQDDHSEKQLMKRDTFGRFLPGNQEGHKIKKGEGGRPKGAQNKKNKLIKEIAKDVLGIDPYIGEEMSYTEYIKMLKWWTILNPRIGVWFLDQAYGKPVEKREHEVQAIQFIMHEPALPEQESKQLPGGIVLKEDNGEDQASLPEGRET